MQKNLFPLKNEIQTMLSACGRRFKTCWHYPKFFLKQWRRDCFEKRLITIRKSIGQQVSANGTHNPKILFALSFSMFEPNKLHDFFLSQALKIRGAKIIPLVEGAVQEGETSLVGGVWGGYGNDDAFNKLCAKKNAKNCLEQDLQLWQKWGGEQPLFLGNYVTDGDKKLLRAVVDTFDISDYRGWLYDGMPIGQWAQHTLCNNELVATPLVVEEYEKKLRAYSFNILMMITALERAITDIAPDIIVTNNTFYYPWSIIEVIAKKKNILLYCHGPGDNRDSWYYGCNKRATPADLTELWETWEHKDLTEQEELIVSTYLENRKIGKNMMLNTANPSLNNNKLDSCQFSLDVSKPTALLTANVSWDAAALGVDIQFSDMYEWIRKVILFFERNQQYNLIIKAHPGEKNQHLPFTRQLLEDEIKKIRTVLPPNIHFLSPTAPVRVYDLMANTKVGLVYTSTVGLEMACEGIPVLTSGYSPYHNKGFTVDTFDENSYFKELTYLLENTVDMDKKRSLARKFLYVYHFVYAIKLNLFDFSVTEGSRLLALTYKDLLPGKNPALDYICESILNGLPIHSHDRWFKNFNIRERHD